MHNHIPLTIFLFLAASILFPRISAQCGENIFTDKDFFTCSPDHQLDSSMSEFPSFLKTSRFPQLTVDIIFNPVSSCTTATSLLDLFIITIKDPSGQETKILDFYWNNAGIYQAKTALGTNTFNRGFSSATLFTTNKWIELVASIDFDNKYFNVGVNVPGQYYYYDTNTLVSFYSSTLGFDINTKFYFCTDIPSLSSGPNFQCSIKTLNIWYTFASGNYGRSYYGALSPVLAAYYRMDEKAGSQISDATGTLASGSFGVPSSKAPMWSSTVGVEFTTANQYIELPAFSTATSTHPFASQSFTISFWFKFNSATTSANIFRYSNSLLDHDNFSLYIDGSGYMTIAMGNQIYSITAMTPISPSVWTLITASYNIYAPAYSTYNTLILYQDQTRVCFSNIIAVGLYNFASSPYRVIIGGPNGFLGTISHLHIFSPAANHVNDLTGCPASSTTLSYEQCTMNLLTSDPLTCISYPCGGPNCNQCSGSSINSCLSCASPYDYREIPSLCSPPPSTPTPPETSPTTNPVIKPTQTTTSTLTKVYNALTKGSSVGFSAAVAGKIFSNIKYLDIGYSLELQDALKYWKSSFVSMGLDLDPPQGLEDNVSEQGVPPTFEKYDVHSDFLMNFWEGTIVLLFIVALFCIVRALEWVTKAAKNKKFPYTTIRTARFMTQNLLYSQFYGIFADVAMYSVLTYRTPNPAKGLSSFGLVLSALLLIITTIILASQFYLLMKYQRLKNNSNALERFLEESQGNFISFEDFKDTSLFRQSFVFLLVLRDFLFSLILTTLFEHTLAQTLLILVMNLAMIALLLWSQPFKKRFNFLQQVFYELVTLAVNVCVIILAFKDHAHLEAYDVRQRIGKFIIVTNLCFNFIVIAFLVYGLVMVAREGYKEYKAKKAKKVSRVIDTFIQSEPPSHLVDKQLDSQKNKTVILNSETSFLHPKSLKDGELPFKGMETSINANDSSDNQLLFQNSQETPIQSQNQDLSLLNIPRTINKNYANKRYSPSQSPQEHQQQNLANNPETENHHLSQNKDSSQPQNLNNANKNFDPQSRIENQRGDNEAQNQRILAIKARNYPLTSFGEINHRRKVRNIRNKRPENLQ